MGHLNMIFGPLHNDTLLYGQGKKLHHIKYANITQYDADHMIRVELTIEFVDWSIGIEATRLCIYIVKLVFQIA